MTSFLDYYTRLKLSNRCKVKVVYYRNGIIIEETGILYKTLGSKSIMIDIGNNEIREIPFWNNQCIIKSIRLLDYMINFVNDINYLFYNPFDMSQLLFDDGKLRKKVFGDTISYECRENMIADDDCYDEDAVNYANIFSTVKQREELFIFLEEIIKELTRYFKDKGMNYYLNYVGIGSTSIVFSIGDKVIKFGVPRRCQILPYCEFLLQPIINADYVFDDKKIHIEVNQKIKTYNKNDLSKASLFLKMILEDIGLSFIDRNHFNIGLLESKVHNCIHYSEIPYSTSNARATSIAYNNDSHLRKDFEFGDLFDGRFPIIKDMDCVYISDINKYVKYLRNNGIDEETIQSVIDDYKNGIFPNILLR